MGERVEWRAGTTAHKVAATVGTVAAWAAVTALGTWGTFPGSSLAAAGTPGQISLGLDGPAGVPLDFSGLLPGGAVTQAVTLVNDGDALSAVVLSTVVVETSLLDSDPRNGLQLSMASCSVAWTPEWACPGERSLSVASGPVVRQVELREPTSRVAWASDHLAVTLTLPATAGSQFEGLRSELVLTFTGVQRSGNR